MENVYYDDMPASSPCKVCNNLMDYGHCETCHPDILDENGEDRETRNRRRIAEENEY